MTRQDRAVLTDDATAFSGAAIARPKIAYLCDHSPLDRNLYSGGNARIHDALQRHAGDVTILPNTWGMAEPVRQAIHALPEGVNLRARWRMHLALSRVIAASVRRALERDRYDILFGAYAFHALANVVPPYPILTVYTSDATHSIYRESEIGQRFRSRKGGRLLDAWTERHERRVFPSVDLLLWPSDWIKHEADKRYGLSDARSRLVPWGANIVPPQAVRRRLEADRPVNLLLIGRDWIAKGGPTVLETVRRLRQRGMDARLTVIGCRPHEAEPGPHVTVHPQLDKARPEQLALFQHALDSAHFLVMPSFESYGFAFCEASAHGVPSLCLRVGGVPVRDGVNGHALPMGSGPDDFADMIQRYHRDPDAYEALVETTRREFEDRLNWDAWGRTAASLMHDALARKRAEEPERKHAGHRSPPG